jgi:hypothetical protein
MQVLTAKDKQLAEAKAFAAKAKAVAEAERTEKVKIVESHKRHDTINSLVAPLSKQQQIIMKDLLESVQTDRLQSQFNKYLPTVIDGEAPAKQKKAINEGKEVTGNRNEEKTTSNTASNESNVFDIKRLAGLN